MCDRNASGQTAVHAAALNDASDALSILLHTCPETVDMPVCLLLCIIIESYAYQDGATGSTPLCLAASVGASKAVEELLDHNAGMKASSLHH